MIVPPPTSPRQTLADRLWLIERQQNDLEASEGARTNAWWKLQGEKTVLLKAGRS